MIDKNKVLIRKLNTGIPGLNEVLGGGLPEYSFNIIAGAPGGGKTTFAHQIMFANANEENPALFFTVLGEPAIKMLRYQQQFDFFEAKKLNKHIHFINLNQVVLDQSLDDVLKEIIKHIEQIKPKIVIVDSFRTVLRRSSSQSKEQDLQSFIQRLALHLTSWQATTFLIGEYTEAEIRRNPVPTVSDGLFWLYQSIERNSVVRKLQIMKSRGQASIPGLHTFRISQAGIEVFPRLFDSTDKLELGIPKGRLSTGIHELDKMIGGGIPAGDSFLVVGPAGSGKSSITTHFIAQGLKENEAGLVAIFEERPEEYAVRALKLGIKVAEEEAKGNLKILYLRPLDLSVDETVSTILTLVKSMKIKRLVIDSLVGFEMALAPSYRHDFRESLYRMMGALSRAGITVMSTVEVQNSFGDLNFTPYSISFLCDDLLRLRYIEIDSSLRRALVVIKMRKSDHSKDFREYYISKSNIEIETTRLRGYRGLSTGIPNVEIPETKID